MHLDAYHFTQSIQARLKELQNGMWNVPVGYVR
jgi:hypothetical protein